MRLTSRSISPKRSIICRALATIVQNMKQKIYHIIIFLLFWFCGVAYSQNPKADILQQDLSGLFDNLSMIGILGEDCSRIDIHITEVRKMDSREYEIKGISRTRLSVICPFKGKVCVDSISSCSQMIKSESTEVDGFIYGHYSFAEYILRFFQAGVSDERTTNRERTE